MGYPSPLTGVARAVTETIFTFSTPFTRENRVHFGARMTLLKTTDSTFSIYSTIPHSPVVIDSMNKLLQEGGHLKPGESFESKITSIVIPDREHTMAVPAWHKALSELNVKPSIIGPHECFLDVESIVTCRIPLNAGYKTLTGKDLIEFGLDPNDPLVTSDNFKFMYFPGHTNLEIVLLDEKNKILMEGDMFFNLQLDSKKNPNSDIFNEQFDGKDPHSGVWGWVAKKVFTQKSLLASLAMKAVYKDKVNCRKGVDIMLDSWKFDKIIPCHGDTIDRNGLDTWKKNFDFLG